jgi:lipopolysaccharide export system permease protein
MKILDRYFIKQFLQITLFALAAFTLIFVVIDLMENLDDFIDHNITTNMIILYYVYFIPEIIRLITPVAVFLASLFTVSRMANQNELTAVKSSGVSLYRIMVPFLVTSFLISVFSIYFGGYVVPLANKSKVKIETVYMKKDIQTLGSNIFFQDSDRRIVSIYTFDIDEATAYRISIQEFAGSDLTKMTLRIDAERMQYDSLLNEWHVYNGIKREFNDDNEKASEFQILNLKNLNFKPEDVKDKQLRPEEMTLSELKNFYKEQIRTGNDPTRTLIEYHSRFAFSMASVIVVFLGLPLASQKKRGGLALQFGISLLFTFLYLGFMKISQAFGKNGVMNPVLTSWFANIVFFAGGILNIIRIKK